MGAGIDYFRLFVGRSGTTEVEITSNAGHSDVLFVDVNKQGPHTPDTVADALKRLAEEVAAHEFTVVRSPFDGDDEGGRVGASLREQLLARLRVEVESSMAVLSHYRTGKALVEGGSRLQESLGEDLVPWLCSSEIIALIDNYNAFLRSEQVKFVLPNSSASDSFLRIPAILRTRRDIEVLARWVLRVVSEEDGARRRDSLVLATDTPGLLTVLLKLEHMLSDLGCRVAQTIVSAYYPFGKGDVDALLPHVVGTDDIVYVLSATRTGAFEDFIIDGLRSAVGADANAAVVVVADMGKTPNVYEGPVRRIALSRLAVPTPPSPGDLAGRPSIHVEPSTFMLRPEIDIRPDDLARLPTPHDDIFYTVAARARSVGVECAPSQSVTSVRPRTRLLSFRVIHERLSEALVSATESPSLVKEAFVNKLEYTALAPKYNIIGLSSAASLRDNVGVERCGRLLEAVGVEYDEVRLLDELEAQEAAGKTVLLFFWGAVTGASIVKTARNVSVRHTPARLDGLVVHFRPPSHAEVEHARRSFGNGSLVPIWTHNVPWDSAFSTEASVLSRWLSSPHFTYSKWNDAVTRRLDVIAPTGDARNWEVREDALRRLGLPDARRLLWVEPPARPGDLGDDWPDWLDDVPTTLLAAASAVEGLRSEHEGTLRMDVAQCHAWEMPPTWVAAVIRVAHPGELWFGARADEQHERASRIADWISDGAQDIGTYVVLGELLAADALGKVPSEASKVFRELAATSRDKAPETIALLLDLVNWSRAS